MKKVSVELSRIILDTRDYRTDLFAPTELCKRLYQEGKISLFSKYSSDKHSPSYCPNYGCDLPEELRKVARKED